MCGHMTGVDEACAHVEERDVPKGHQSELLAPISQS